MPTDKQREAGLIDLCKGFHKFHTPDNKPYMVVKDDNCSSVMPIQYQRGRIDTRLSAWVKHRYYRVHKLPVTLKDLGGAIEIWAAEALYDGPCEPVYLRFGKHENSCWVFLNDSAGRAVKIAPENWSIENDLPVRFCPTNGMLSLPIPERVDVAEVQRLRRFINLEGDEYDAEWLLSLVWLLWSMLPEGPYPLLIIVGGQGQGKSYMSGIFRRVIDPNTALLSSLPKSIDDLLVAGLNCPVLAFDNVSKITPGMSDALCRIATGAGLQKRQLYTNTDLVSINLRRPIIANGITEFVERPDLIDRSIFVNMPPIKPEQRKLETVLEHDFAQDHPKILGGLLTLLSAALKTLRDVKDVKLARMADFHRFGIAVERAMNFEKGTFTTAYEANRRVGALIALDADPIAPALHKFLRTKPSEQFTVTDIMNILRRTEYASETHSTYLPRNAADMAAHLRRLEPVFTEFFGFCLTRAGAVRSHTRKWVYTEASETAESRPEESDTTGPATGMTEELEPTTLDVPPKTMEEDMMQQTVIDVEPLQPSTTG